MSSFEASLAAALSDPERGLVELDRLDSAESLAAFVRLAWPVLEPSVALKWGWAVGAICEHLEAVSAGQINRLLMNVPPGMMKSLITGVFWPAWEWGPKGRPETRIIGSSYSEDYATRDNRRMRDLVASDWYQARWGDRVRLTRVAETSFANDAMGFRQGIPFNRLTGGRADRLIIDDPHSTEGAESDAERERALRIFRESVPTRLNDPERSAIVIIMQRLHHKDISGEIVARELGYVHLCLPMRFEPERRCATVIGFQDPRQHEGELLFPERFPEPVVAALERTLGSYATAGQLQQRPAPRGGGLIKVDRLELVDDYPRGGPMVRRWDFAATAASAGSDPDWTAGALLTMRDGIAYIVDIARGRGGPADVERLVRRTAERDGEGVTILLEQEPGSSGKLVVDHYQRRVLLGFPTYARAATGSKVQRADPFIAAVEAGNVRLVRGAWNEAFLDEARTFPNGAHDDQIDAVADAYLWCAGRQAVDAPIIAGPMLASARIFMP